MKTTNSIIVALTLFALGTVGSTVVGCKKHKSSNNQTSSGGGPAAIDPVKVIKPSDMNGSWKGSNNQGLPMEFIVASERVSVFQSCYTFIGGGCAFDGWSSTSYDSGTGPLIGADLKFTETPVGSYFTGTFTSETAANGTFRRTTSSCGSITYTWTATKNGVGSSSLKTVPAPGKYFIGGD